jgi:hypothetical protein
MAKKPEPPPKLFWLTYRHPDGPAAVVVVIESHGLLHARLARPTIFTTNRWCSTLIEMCVAAGTTTAGDAIAVGATRDGRCADDPGRLSMPP